ncbi:MAG: oxidative damage protection protein [Deltaproteobacteria bacterium]|nr:oxidative damage protection protein [Deltaproteobacteria bacterium]
MARMVQCKKLSRELPGLNFKPFQNDLGQKIFDNVSEEAWRMWLEHAKMIINEYRMNLADPASQQKLLDECDRYFFGEGSALPPDFVPQTQAAK